MNLFTVLLLTTLTVQATPNLDPFSDEFIHYINNAANTTWKAGRTTRFKSIDEVKQLLGARKTPLRLRQKVTTRKHNLDGIHLPKSFDARQKWPDCKSISTIRDQSSCGSCWAFGAVEVMTDRICIFSDGKNQDVISPTDLIACCSECGDGCYGGWPLEAFRYWAAYGLVTGGSKEDNTGCLPYPFAKCEHHSTGKYPSCPSKIYPTPRCVNTCRDGYATKYQADKHYGAQAYQVEYKPETIMQEIMQFGPVEAAFDVYADFVSYHSGVYQHVSGDSLGGHAIRMLGWGEENGTPYWLIANSWNEDWGEAGYFKILRGKDECGIESDVVAGIPRL